ncbi:MAG: hypothetical protein ACD_60C00028G0014 [uncultured bacterium]|nr:MAG: hypothetical protein ACD_60C00028G0014 [uncultured bacterium]
MTKNSPTFLATTALSEFWDTSQSLLFLGEWCTPHHTQDIWQSLNAQKLSRLALEDSQSFSAYSYTLEVYQKLLPQLAEWLNHIHGVHYSLRYWKIIIGPFLLWYIQVVYDRFLHLKAAYTQYPEIKTIGLSSDSYLTPMDTFEFYLLATESDAWNLQLFTQIMEFSFVSPESYRDVSWENEIKQRLKMQNQQPIYKKMTKIKINMLRFFSYFRAKKAIGMYFCGLSNKNIFRLWALSNFRVFPIVQMSHKPPQKKHKLDLGGREKIMDFSIEDDFSRLILNTLKINLPLNFVENYREEAVYSEKCFPYRANMVVGAGWNPDDRFKFWGAKMAEHGAKIVDIQHGGGYGTHGYSAREFLERDNCDAFISWGWKNGHDVIPLPSISACEKYRIHAKKRRKENDLILWVANEVPRYLLSIENSLHVYSGKKSYTDLQARFARKLLPSVFEKVTMRVRPFSKHVYQIKKELPTLNVYQPNDKDCFFEQLTKAKIMVSDNLQTTFLYSLAFGIPTLLFGENELDQINQEFRHYFEGLSKVGIYHDSPESAADMLNKVMTNPLDWWQSAHVQAARQTFCHHFVRITPDWLRDWANRLVTT